MEDPAHAVRVHQGQERAAGRARDRGGRRQLLLRGRAAVRARGQLQGGVQEADREARHRVRAHRRLRGRPQGHRDPARARARPPRAQGQGAQEVRQQGPRRGRRARRRGRVEADREARHRADRHPRPIHRRPAGEPHHLRGGAPPGQGRQARRLAGRAALRHHLSGDQDGLVLRDPRGLARPAGDRGGEPIWTPRERPRPRCSPARRT